MIGIVAFSKNRGIGSGNKLMWSIPEDLAFFKNITHRSIVIMGRKTYESIGKPLPNRLNVVITSRPGAYDSVPGVIFVSESGIWDILDLHTFDYANTFVIGGEKVYRLFFEHMRDIYVTYIDKCYDEADTFFPNITSEFQLVTCTSKIWSQEEGCNYMFMKYTRPRTTVCCDSEYLRLAEKVVREGARRPNRTGIDTISCFGEHLTFDISKSVPLLTTKRMAWKSCIEELLWFMRGDTDAKLLDEKKVKIWNDNSSRAFLDKVGLSHLEEGDCGANYSFQWRHFGQDYKDCDTEYEKKTSTDQINNIIRLLQTDRHSRRIFMSAWNPCDLNKTVLPPCHVSAQFYVDENDGLSCHMYQRSCDVFLGLPFNIFSYTVLTYILATKCDLTPKSLHISLGDTHVYTNHVLQMKEQLSRPPLCNPKLFVSHEIKTKEIEDISIDDFELVGYHPHSSIKAEMAV